MKRLLRSRSTRTLFSKPKPCRALLDKRIRQLTFETFEQRLLLDGGLVNSVLTETQRQQILTGLGQVASWTDSLSTTGRLGQPVAVINQSIGQSVGLRSILETQLITPVNVATGGGVGTTTDAIVTALKGLSFNSSGLAITVNPASVTGGLLTGGGDNELQFNLTFDAVRTSSMGLNLGQQVVDAGLTLDSAARVSLNSTLHFVLTFGVDLTVGIPPDQQFFIRSQSLALGSSVHTTTLSTPAKIGLLGAAISNGSLDLTAGVSVALINPDADSKGNLTLEELQSTSAASLASFTTSSDSLAATLPMTATLGSQVLNAALLGSVPTATLTTTSIFTGPDEVLLGTNASLHELQNFRDVTPSGLLATLDRVGQGVQDAAPELDVNRQLGGLPYVATLPSGLANFTDLANKIGRDLYDPVMVASRPISSRSGYSLGNDASFSIQLNDAAPIAVTILQTNQFFQESLNSFVNRSLPVGLAGKIVATQATTLGGQRLAFKAIDPAVTRFTILISDRTNSATADMGFEPSQFSTPEFKFDSVQSFATAIAVKMGLSAAQVDPKYDVATHSLSLEIRLLNSTYSQTVPLDFGAGLGPATFLAPVSASMVVTPTASGRVALRVDALRTVFAPATDAPDAPANGRLSADAHFKLQLDGAAAVSILVPRDLTNNSLDDLVADINTALSFSTLRGKVTAGRVLNHLTLISPAGTSLQVDSIASDPAATQMHFTGVGVSAQYGKQVSLSAGTQISIGSSVTATNVSGLGAVGILPATLTSPSLSVTANASATLAQSQAVGSLASAAASVLVVATPQVSLAGTVTVTVDAALGVPGGSPAAFTLALSRPNEVATTLKATADAPANGQLTSPATFQISVGSGTPVTVTVPVDATNTTIDDLVADINTAIEATRLGGNVVAGRSLNRLTLSTNGFASLTISSAVGDATKTKLRFNDVTLAAAIGFTTNTSFMQRLAPVQTFVLDDFLESVRGIQKLIEDQQFKALTTDIPLFGQSLDDALGLTQKFSNVVLGLQGKTGTPLKLAAQGIVENLRSAIRGLPTTLPVGATDDLNRLFDDLRVAAQTAGEIDVVTPVNLASVIIASIAPMAAAIAKVNFGGVDLIPLNNVLASLNTVTPSLLQLSSTFASGLGVGTTTGQFVSANLASFEQALVVKTAWTQSIQRPIALGSINLPNGLGPLKFGSGSSVTMNVGADFRFEFGFNMAKGTAFLLDTSKFNATASLAPPSQTYPATIGGVTVTLGNPAAPVAMQIGTSANAVPATLAVTVNPTSHVNDTGTIAFADVPGMLNYTSINGKLSSTLPVYLTGVAQGNVTINWAFPGAGAATPPTVTAPAALGTALQNLPYNFAILTDGISEWDTRLKDLLRKEILGKFPLVSDDINVDSGFISKLENQFLTAVQSAITTAGGVDSNNFRTSLYDKVNAALASLLVPSSLTVSQNNSPEIRFRIQGTDTYHSGLRLDLPGLGFETYEPGDVKVDVNFDLRLGFGISKTEGFYFIIDRSAGANAPQFTLNVGAVLSKDSQIAARLFGLPVVAKTSTDAGGLSLTKVPAADLKVRLKDIDNHLTADQLDPRTFASEFQVMFGADGASVHVDLHLVANTFDAVNGDVDLPGIVTDLRVDQSFPTSAPLDDPGSIPLVKLDNIGLTLGSTLSKIVEPITRQIDQYLGPLKPAIVALESEVPVLSQLSKKAGKGKLTWIDAIARYSDDPDVQETVAAMHKVADLVRTLTSLSAKARALAQSATAGIVFGDYHFAATYDLRVPRPGGVNPADPATGTFIPRPEFTPTSDGTISPYVKNQDASIGTFLGDELKDDGVRFPIFEDPKNVLPLLFGQDASIVVWHLPQFKAKFRSPDIFLGVIPVGPVPVTLNAGLDFSIGVNVGLGFDTRGFRAGHKFADGFFFQDEGRSAPAVLSFGAGVHVSASVGIPFVATVGIEGRLGANLAGFWHNPDHDDKLHLDELLDNIAQGPECILDLDGQITAQLSFYISAVTYSLTIPIVPEITLFDFTVFACSPLPPPEPAHIANPVVLAEMNFENVTIAAGTLILHTGPFAGLRNPGQSKDTDERMQVFQFQPGVITVTGFGQSKVYGTAANPVKSIYADGGAGKNVLLVDASVTLPVTLVGGAGNDQLRGGSGKNRLVGRGGDDVLVGGIDNDVIDAGTGNAKLYGGPGNDLLSAVGGANYLDGDDGVDTLQGGTGADTIDGGKGNDKILGGGGADVLLGGDDNDTITGQGAQGVYVEGGRGNNTIYGSGGPDVIYAVFPNAPAVAAGTNIVFAGAGNDKVYGGTDGTNEIHGGPDDDLLYGGLLADLIHADSGTDIAFGGEGDDTIYADSGTNKIYGGLGNDTIYGSSGVARPVNWPSATPPGFDVTYAGSGTDELYGESGVDTIYGGVGNATIDGGAMADFIYGGNGIQTLLGNTGDDFIRSGDGTQAIAGDAGDDLLEQVVGANQTLTDTTLMGRGTHTFSTIERVRLVDSSVGGGFAFDVSGYTGIATLVGAASGTDAVKVVVDADVTLANGNLKTSIGGSFLLQNITKALVTGIRLDNTFDVSLWTGTATITGGLGLDRVLSVNDTNFVLSDTSLTKTSGGNFTLSGIRRVTLAGGLLANSINAAAFTGIAWLYGAGGNDTLTGGSGNDYLDGGPGVDTLTGNSGDDVIVATASIKATISAGAGDDTVYGSEGDDTVDGSTGRDRIYARAGIDKVTGGTGDDIIDGGSGNDTLSGDAGADLIIGGAGGDTIYAFNLAGVGDDSAVNFLYGDFGTLGVEPGAGNDTLNGGLGIDQMFGEGGTNTFTGGGAGSLKNNTPATGLRPNTLPAEPPIPQPANWPPLLPGQTVTLPNNADEGPATGGRGRWSEYSGSATGGGISNSPAAATDPVVAVGPAGRFVAWIDSRSGAPQVFAALSNNVGWQELAGSAHGGGVSGPLVPTGGAASKPAITLDSGGLPIITWTQAVGTATDVFVAHYDSTANSGNGGWVSLGPSLSAGGISGTGKAASPQVTTTTVGPVVAWLDSTGGVTNVFARRLENNVWIPFGANSASGSGVSASASSVSDLAIASDGTKVAVGWTQNIGARTQIYAKQFLGSAFSALGGSTSGNGLSGTTGSATSVSFVYFSGSLRAAWSDNTSGHKEIYAASFDGAQWIDAGDNSRTGGGVSATAGNATAPQLAAGGTHLELVWLDDRVAAHNGNSTAIYNKVWNNTTFVEELSGDASGRGIGSEIVGPGSQSIAVDSAGHPFVVWSDSVSGKSEVYLRGNTFDVGTVHYVNDTDIDRAAVVANSVVAASGNDLFDGLTRTTPKRSIRGVLEDAVRPLNPGDVIFIDAGSYDGALLAGAAANGILVLGSAGEPATINSKLLVNGGSNVTLTRLTLNGGVRIGQTTNTTIVSNYIRGAGVTIVGGSTALVTRNTIAPTGTGVSLGGNAAAPVVRANLIRGGASGIAIVDRDPAATAASGVVIRGNRIVGAAQGLSLQAAATGRVSNNRIIAASIGINSIANFAGLITGNEITKSATGIYYGVPTLLDNNRIHDGTIGITTIVNSTSGGLGFFGSTRPNQIDRNTTGVNLLAATMQNQWVLANIIGVSGNGSMTPIDVDHTNTIALNMTGVDIVGPVTFNRISRNATGVIARSGQLITHNVFDDNAIGVAISALSDVRVVSNTFVTAAGDNVRITGGSREIELRGNILWTSAGYDIYVDNASTVGFASDYNSLIADGTGKLVYWTRDFNDILDWQEDVHAFDLHSIGTTVVDPLAARPSFISRSLGDFRIFDLIARQRRTSPTIDAADPRTDQGQPPTAVNLLTNPSFEAGLSGWTATPSGITKSATPAPFDGGNYFAADSNATTTLTQTVDLVAAGYLPAAIDSFAYRTTFGARARSAAEIPVDRGTLTVTFLNASNATIGIANVISANNTPGRWELIGDSVMLPVGARKIVFRYEAVRQSGSTNDVYLDNAFVGLTPRAYGVDIGARGNTTAEIDMAAHLRLTSPDLYQDWERNKSIKIRWDSFGNTADSPVSIDLLQDTATGPVFVTNITTSTPDNGSFTWIAGNSGVDFGTKGLRIQISLATNLTVFDRSSETFAVPENTNTFFVNDKVTTGDQYTTAIGSNRNTGKVAAAPKPYPNNILRIYSLGPNQTLSIDTGDYPLLNPLLISNTSGIGDDEGFAIKGSTAKTTSLHHANSLTVAPIIELNGADFMTLKNLTLSGGTFGLFVHNLSTNLAASYLSAVANSQGGFRIDTGSSVLGLDHLRADQNLGTGIYINALVGSLSNSVVSNNLGYGLQLLDTGATAIEANQVFNNTGNYTYGVYLSNSIVGIPLVFGNASIALGRGNLVHDNSPHGVYATGNVSVAGNTVYSHTTANSIGITVINTATAIRNVAFDNAIGLYSNGGELRENRSYHNTDAGIAADAATSITNNVVYSNPFGVRGNFAFNGTLTGNIIYANSNVGFVVTTASYYGGATTLVNNTFVQPFGDAIRAISSSKNLRLRNNVISVSAGFGLNIAPDSQTGFQSDYNDFDLSGNGQVALWQNVGRPSLAAWRITAFTDANSLSVSPQFVDEDGADNLLGYASPTADGRDDDFHLQSAYGSFHGIAFAPITSGIGTGAPTMLVSPGNPVLDEGTSALIDRGDATDSFAAEPKPNGGYINIGAYSGTNQASISPARYVTVISPDGGEVWPQGQTFAVRWRSKYDNVANGTFKIELVQGQNLTPILTIASAASAAGTFNWTIPAALPVGNDYRVRVTRNDFPTIFDESDSSLQITVPISVYYVNDGAVQAGDTTTAVGDDIANNGLTIDHPKASISGVLNSYVVKPGDTIYVDAGIYNLSTTLVLTAATKGIKIVGYSNPSFPDRSTIIDRGNAGQNVIELQNADDILLDHLTIRGGYDGVSTSTTADSDHVTISNSLFTANVRYGVLLDSSNDQASILGNTFNSITTYYSLGLYGTDAVVSTNNFTGGFYDSGTVRGARSVIKNNTFIAVRSGIGVSNYSSVPADRIVVQDNVYSYVKETAIGVGGNTLVTGNQIAYAGTGIYGNGEFRNNIVQDGITGISASYSAIVEDNRVLHNSGVGLYLSSNASNRNNRIYDNSIGIQTDLGYSGVVNGNIIYNNTTYGVLVSGTGYYGGTPTIANNTIVQTVGDAVHVSDSRAQNIFVKNNILQVASGYAIAVDSTSGRGFRSDYNDIFTTGTGKIGLWEDLPFNDRADWFYEVGLDEHTTFADPQFVGLAGADGSLGYDRMGGLRSKFYNTNDLTGPVALTRIDPTLNFDWYNSVNGGSPGAGVNGDNFSVRWSGYLYVPAGGSYTFYTQADDGIRLYLDGNSTPVIDQWTNANFAEQSFTTSFATAGYHQIQVDLHELTGDARIRLSWSSAAISKQIISSDYLGATNLFSPRDHGADDNFSVLVTSPTLDGGDPNDLYFREPNPNGGRINIGAVGNTPQAQTSPSQLLQLLSPNGLEKFEQGQTVPISFRSNGLKTTQPVMLLNAGNASVNAWQTAIPYLTVGNSSQNATLVSLVGVAGPAPQDVYQTYFYGSGAAGAALSFSLPVNDGKYSVRLHFVEFDYSAANQRKFDIKLGDATVATDYDIFAAAGARYKAQTETFINIVVSNGKGLSIDLINKLGGGAVLSAIEVFSATPQGTANSIVALDYSSNGVDWIAIPGATAVRLDRWGNGKFNWTIPADFAIGNNYKIRARSTGSTGEIKDSSDTPFLVTNAGHDFYLNDKSKAGDVFTTAIGKNANSGKSPDQPIASLQALLAAYSFGPGDVVHVDSGNYRLIRTAVLTSRHSKVKIEGPTPAANAAPLATFDRANPAFNVIELQNADDVTVDHLAIRGGYDGISTSTTTDSDHFTISNSLLTANVRYGVLLDSSNDQASVFGNTFNSATTYYSIGLYGTDAVVTTNNFTGGFYDSGSVRGARSVIKNNTFTAVRNGIGVNNYSTIPADRIVVQDNVYSNVRETAIGVGGNTLVTGNQITGAGTGLFGNGEFRNNVVQNGITGINASYSAVVEDNRVLHNSGVGLYLSSNASTRNNRIYDNAIGIQTDLGYSGVVSSNIIYNNSLYGVLVSGTGYYGGTPTIANNTIVQNVGDAVHISDDRAQNVLVKNNILQVNSGYAIAVDNNSGRGFRSDYNDIFTTGTGKIGLWENHDFTDRGDWFYEVGLDQHSSFADPQFVGLAGADGLLGYNRGGGLSAKFYNTNDLTGPVALTRIDPSINFDWYSSNNGGSPGPGVNGDNFSVRWSGYLYVPAAGTYTFYTQADDGVRLYLNGRSIPVIDQWAYTGFAENSYTTSFAAAGYHAIKAELHETTGDARIRLSWSSAGIAKQIIPKDVLGVTSSFPQGDHGADDNFAILASSPTIDAGDPSDLYFRESSPNGGRINVGAYGNSTLAQTSPSQQLQVLSPNGLEKLEQGQTIPISFRSSGLKTTQTIAMLNAGSASVENWQSATPFLTVGNSYQNSNVVSLAGVVDPAPQAVYQTYFYGSNAASAALSLALPLANGKYSVRLHFVEYDYSAANGRKFDIKLNGTTVKTDYDVFAAAGARYQAKTESFSNVVVSNGKGLVVDLINKFGGAIISAIEVFTATPQGLPNPKVNLDVTADNGATWTTIATNLSLDIRGQGLFNWTVPAGFPGSNNYRLRASSVSVPAITDQGDGKFSVAGSGLNYYLSPTGDNRNNGKSPARPMRSLSGLINAYDLDPADVVNLLDGTYRTYRDIIITSQDSGVTIRGNANSPSILNRGNTRPGTQVFGLQNADFITLDQLRLTGAEIGLFAADNSDADDLTITNSQLYGNSYAGAWIGAANDRWNFTSNKIYGLPGGVTTDDQSYGIFYNSSNSTVGHRIVNNEIYDHGNTGIFRVSSQTLISNNDIHGNRDGIYAGFSNAAGTPPLVIDSNKIHDNSEYGLYVDSGNSSTVGALVTNNQVYGQNGDNDVGLYVYNGTQATGNNVYGNYNGIVTTSYNSLLPSKVSANRLFNNRNVAIVADGLSQVVGNYVFSNSIGVQAINSFYGTVADNLVYANTNRGLLIQNYNNNNLAQFLNNTIYQTVGDGIRLDSSARNNLILNNIVSVLAGYALYVDNNSQTGFVSDYNLFQQGADPNAYVGFWNGVPRDLIADWKTASGKDTNSLEGNPGFVDIDGADNVFGYVSTPNGNIDGGLDDNFYRGKNSPATDRGQTWDAAITDIEGFGRFDDPTTTNAGGSRYTIANAAPLALGAGTAQNWNSDDNYWSWTLPFAFPFYGTTYTSAYVSSNGFIQFGSNSLAYDGANSTLALAANARIAPLWDDLTTTGAGDNIYLDSSIAGQATVRWNATNKATNTKVSFSATLFSDGRIQFQYGALNTDLTPTVGISRGNGRQIELVSGYDGATSLTNPTPKLISTIPGLTDIGAYEFRGRSNDAVPPKIISSTPAPIQSNGVIATPVSELQLTFSEEINPIDARSPAAYELRGAGVNDLFGDADDIVYVLHPSYTPGQNAVVLAAAITTGPLPGGTLPVGLYRITVFAGVDSAIHDLAGNRLDGLANGQQGSNFVRNFKVTANVAPTLLGSNSLTTIQEEQPDASNPGTLITQILNGQITDLDGPLRGLAISKATSPFGTWQYALNGTNFLPIAPKLAGGKLLLLAADNNTRVRFQPNVDFAGTANDLVFNAWDQADELLEGTNVLPSLLAARSISSATATASITVTNVNDKPVIGAFDTAVTYTANSSPVVLDTDATVSDLDSANFDTGTMTISISLSAQLTDVLSIQTVGAGSTRVTLSGNTVLVGNVAIGTFSGGTNKVDLVVTFNAAATAARSQALLRAIAFSNTSGTPSTLSRTIKATLTDGDGGTSDPMSKTVNVLSA